MNRIKALLAHSDYYEEFEHLHFSIDGRWLDELIDELIGKPEVKDLAPTLLYDLQNESEQLIVWDRILPPLNEKQNCPILMCLDDADFSCNIIIAEIENFGAYVKWNRIGRNQTAPSDPADIGKIVEWFENVPEFVFDKNEYLKMLWAFKTQFIFAHHENLVRLRSGTDKVSLEYFKSRRLPFISTIDTYQKKIEYLISNGWTEDGAVYRKIGIELFWDNSTALEVYSSGSRQRIEDTRIETVEELHQLVERYEKKHRRIVEENIRSSRWRVMNRRERMNENGTPIEPDENPDDVVFISLSGKKDFNDYYASQISCFPELISIHVDDTAITDAGVEHLCKLKKLKYLNLRKTNVTDKCIKAISSLPVLDTLWLNNTNVIGHTLFELEKNKKLKQLFLCGSQITDEETHHLAKLQHVHYLSIGSTRLTKKSFETFRKMPALRTLLIENTGVTEEEGNQLQSECPSLRVDTTYY